MKTPSPCTITFIVDRSLLKPEVGVAPLGYCKNFVGDQVVIAPDEETAPYVILAFTLAARGVSFREILKTVNSEGLRSNRGNTLSLSSLHNMLTNPFYVGDLQTAKNLWKYDHAPLISRTLFRRVRKTLRARAKRPPSAGLRKS